MGASRLMLTESGMFLWIPGTKTRGNALVRAQYTTVNRFSAGESARMVSNVGAAHRSPLEGRRVESVEGVVTAVLAGGRAPGFWMQDPRPDRDEATSEAIFVFTKDVAASVEPGASGIAGAVYVSCSGRGGPHFGGPSAELQIVRRALGDVPLVGFFAAGEIARHHLYGYTGVLTVFTTRP